MKHFLAYALVGGSGMLLGLWLVPRPVVEGGPYSPPPRPDWNGDIEFRCQHTGETLYLRPTRMVVGPNTVELVPNGALTPATYRLTLADGTRVYAKPAE